MTDRPVTTYIEVGPDEPLPPVTEEQLRQLGDILVAVDARLEREALNGGPVPPWLAAPPSSDARDQLEE